MKIDVPVFNEDGSVQFTATLTPELAQSLLQFAINFQMAVGNHVGVSIGNQEELEDYDD